MRSLLLLAAALCLCSSAYATSYPNYDECFDKLNLPSAKQMLQTVNIAHGNNQVMTVVAPTEEAILSYLDATGLTAQWFFAQYSPLSAITEYMVWPDVRLTKSELVDGQYVKTLLGQFQEVQKDTAVRIKGGSQTNVAKVVFEYQCGPNILLVVDTLLVPDWNYIEVLPAPPPVWDPAGPFASIFSAIQAIPDLSMLNQMILSADNPHNLTARLTDPDSELTFFATIDAGVGEYLFSKAITLNILNQAAQMPMMLFYMATEGSWTAEQLVHLDNPTTMGGLSNLAFWSTPMGETFVEGWDFSAKILSQEIICGKSRLFVVDKMMVPRSVATIPPVSAYQAIHLSPLLTSLALLDSNTNVLHQLGLDEENSVSTFLAPSNDAITRYLEKKNTNMAMFTSNPAAVLKMVKAQTFTNFYHPAGGFVHGMTINSLGANQLNVAVTPSGQVSIKPHNSQPAINIVGTISYSASWVVYIVDDLIFT